MVGDFHVRNNLIYKYITGSTLRVRRLEVQRKFCYGNVILMGFLLCSLCDFDLTFLTTP